MRRSRAASALGSEVRGWACSTHPTWRHYPPGGSARSTQSPRQNAGSYASHASQHRPLHLWVFQLHWDPLFISFQVRDPRRCGLLPAQAALRHDAKQYTKNVRLRIILMQLRQQNYTCGIEPVHAFQVLPPTQSRRRWRSLVV